ncbi:ABC transporter substrate-binding protein [Arthrobacter sp. SDTb3-6]|uniref:ABC transporter substrate-binding protein n=1 Tax=Arthrobacter sp. SDTb3-6 TaxID=2713571 RepID=UPI00159DE54D|nr:extracellular solute-binding protein [Arthrobacter sp. SDTb3-6]NVM98218.1 extracellular solute-binding protein [Arthrobacter sp. SDTb3-6]
MKLSSKIPVIGTGLLLVMGMAACGSADASSSVVTGAASVNTTNGLVINGETIADKTTYDKAKTETLSLYSGYTESSEAALVAAFTKDTGIKVNVVRLTPNKLSERVLSEKGAGKLGADVIRTSDYRIAKSMEDAGVWQNYDVPGASKFKDVSIDGGKFTRMFDSVYTLGYNTQLVKEADAPTSWADAVSGKWQGKIGIVQGGSGGSTAALNRFMDSKLGPDYFKSYAAQKPTIYDSLGAEATALARGEVAVGTVTISGTNLSAVQDKAPVKFIVPKEGLVAYDYFLGMTSSAKNTDAAKVFMNYNLSKQGQKIFGQLGEYPVRTDVAPPTIMGVQLPAIDSGKVYRMTNADAINFGKSDLAKWNQVFGYTK